MERKLVISPSILTHWVPSPGADGKIACFMLPLDGRIGRGRVYIKIEGEHKPITAVIEYVSPKGMTIAYKSVADKDGIATFDEYYSVEAGGSFIVRLLNEDESPAVANIMSAGVCCAFVPSASNLILSVVGGVASAEG